MGLWQAIRSRLAGPAKRHEAIPSEVQGLIDELRRKGFLIPEPRLVAQAMTHQSYVNERKLARTGDYQRLEFLGDAVLELVVRRYLYERCPEEQEGDLSMRKSMMVRRGFIGGLAKTMGLPRHLLIGQGEDATGGREKPSILADVFEALLGALLLNDGFAAVERWLQESFSRELASVTFQPRAKSFKNQVQEIVQERYGVLPRYKVLGEAGPEHRKTFAVGLFVGKRMYGQGEGRSKKVAEEAAARDALEELAREGAGASR